MFGNMLKDGTNDSISSKRVVTFLSFLLLATAFLTNLFYSLKIEQFMFDSMMYIVIAGLGFTASEKFAPPTKKPIL
jgi:hypothetical protein